MLAPTVKSLSIYLKIYKEYFNNMIKADKMMQQIKKHPKFNEVIKINDSIEDLLSRPFQRPLKYKLLVGTYLDDLPKHHKDYKQLAI